MISIRVSDRATPYLKQVYGQELNRTIGNLSAAAQVLLEKFQEATSPTPNFSLSQLKAMGHPYGKKPTEKTRGPIPHAPEWLINQQTGQLHRDLTVFPMTVTPDYIWVQVGVKRGSKTEKYGPMVVGGTEKMIGRNFLVQSMFENYFVLRKILHRTRVRRGTAWNVSTGAPWRD